MPTIAQQRPRSLLQEAMVVAAAGAIIGAWLEGDGRWLHWICKPLATALILRLAWTPAPISARYRRWIGAGIACSLAGDICLMLPADLFAAGLACFLIAHVCFLAALAGDARLGVRPLPWLVCLAIGALDLWLLWPALPGPLRAPVIIYVAALAGMTGQAWARARWHAAMGDSLAVAARRAAAGAGLFMLSDGLLAWDRFMAPLPLAMLWILASYYAALWLIARSVARA